MKKPFYKIKKEELPLIHFVDNKSQDVIFSVRNLGGEGSTINGNYIINFLFEFWYRIARHQIHSVIEFKDCVIEDHDISEILELIECECNRCLNYHVTIWQSSAGFIGRSDIRFGTGSTGDKED